MKKKYLMLSLLLSGLPFAAFVGAQDTLTIHFAGMDSLNDQKVYVSVFDAGKQTEVDRSVFMTGSSDSTLAIGGITAGGPYYVDFFIDKNKNGSYDAPPVDQAWRIMLDSLAGGDTTITFAYNDTSYQDIMWRNRLRMAFTGMDTLAGKNLYFSLRNQDGTRQIRSDSMNSITPKFNHDFFDIMPDSSYQVVFFADMDTNAKYDSADYAWLIYLDHLKGDTIIPFTYNRNFANNIVWMDDSSSNHAMPYTLTLNFSQMSENVGKPLTFYWKVMNKPEVIDSLTMTVDSADFIVIIDSLSTTHLYNLDFYSDMNGNGTYDAPPVDQAWRIELKNIKGDTIINFVHNTNFTDIMSDSSMIDTNVYKLTVVFTGYETTVGQNFTVYLKNATLGQVVDSVTISPLDSSQFTVVFDSVNIMPVYNIDFFVDANSNGTYDAPPTDKSWRIRIEQVNNDTTITFIYDTVYTDLNVVSTGVGKVDDEDVFSAYPNPVHNELNLSLRRAASDVSIYTLTGSLVMQKKLMAAERQVNLNVSDLKPGMYILRLNDGSKFIQQKFLKE